MNGWQRIVAVLITPSNRERHAFWGTTAIAVAALEGIGGFSTTELATNRSRGVAVLTLPFFVLFGWYR
jgi:hypothetical protein